MGLWDIKDFSSVTPPQEYFVGISYDYDNLQNQVLGGTLKFWMHHLFTSNAPVLKHTMSFHMEPAEWMDLFSSCLKTEVHKAIFGWSNYQNYMADPLKLWKEISYKQMAAVARGDLGLLS